MARREEISYRETGLTEQQITYRRVRGERRDDNCPEQNFSFCGSIGILKNNREKEKDLVATAILGGTGIVAISGSDRPPCRSVMFRTGRDAGAYRDQEGDSPVAPTTCPPLCISSDPYRFWTQNF